jgi:hypothetical protein
MSSRLLRERLGSGGKRRIGQRKAQEKHDR